MFVASTPTSLSGFLLAEYQHLLLESFLHSLSRLLEQFCFSPRPLTSADMSPPSAAAWSKVSQPASQLGVDAAWNSKTEAFHPSSFNGAASSQFKAPVMLDTWNSSYYVWFEWTLEILQSLCAQHTCGICCYGTSAALAKKRRKKNIFLAYQLPIIQRGLFSVKRNPQASAS